MKTSILLKCVSLAMLLAILAACAPAATPTPAAPTAAPAQPTQPPPPPTEPAATQPPATEAPKALRVALILPGRADDVSWNQAAYEGMQKAVKMAKVPVELKVVEQVYDPVDIEPALRDYAQQGYDLIVGHGFQFQEPIIKVAPEFPNVNFAIGTGFKLAPNASVYDVKLEQGGYVMGILAAYLSKVNIIGAIGGVDVSEIHRGHVAFVMGARSVKPDIKVLNNFVGDWNDLAGAKEAAMAQINAGADVLWQSGDGIGLATLETCKEQKLLCFGNTTVQTQLAPENVVASFVYDWSAAFVQMIDKTADKTFGNEKIWAEFANQGAYIDYNEALKNLITPEMQAAVDTAVKGFVDGTLDLGDLDAAKLE